MIDVVDAPDPRISRLDRLRDSRGWSASGSVGGFAAATIAGFDPVGQVFGTTVAYLGPPGLGRCFVPPSGTATGSAPREDQASVAPYSRLLAKLRAARVLALERAVDECRALGGDGIIGMRVKAADFLYPDTVEVTVEGTAVRARSLARPGAPFTTHVSGQELARLLSSGWVPFALVFGMTINACHVDGAMFQETRRAVGGAGNREVSGYTRLVNDARRQARRGLEEAVQEQGGAGAVVHESTLHISERDCPLYNQHTDYLAEATILGSAVTPFEASTSDAQAHAPLTIMRLDARPETAAGSESGPDLGPKVSLGDRAFAYWAGRQGQVR